MVGGGDTAMEDATFLSKFASDVKIVNRRDELRASAIMADRARDTENIEFVTPYVVERFEAGENGSLDKAVLNHAEGGEDRELDIDGAFIAIGHRPNSDLVKDQLELDENGYVLVEGRSSRTALPGVFAAGDLVDHVYRQAVTAAGMGCMAALDAEAYLRDTPPDPEKHWSGTVGADAPGVDQLGREQRCAPERVERPGSEEELCEVVAGAERVKAVGTGHSFTDIACTDGVMVDLSRMNRVLGRGRRAGQGRRPGSGSPTARASWPSAGLALENQGDIDKQALAGAVATATHGTGARFRNLSAQIAGDAARDRGWRAARARGRRPPGRPGLARCARSDLGADDALRPRLHDPPARRAPPARGGARRARRRGRRQRPLRVLRLPLRGPRPDAHLGAHRPRARAAARVAREGSRTGFENGAIGLATSLSRLAPAPGARDQPHDHRAS